MPVQTPALTIKRSFSRPDRKWIDFFRGVPTGFVVDARGRTGALDYRIHPLIQPCAFAGPAVTVQTVPGDNLAPWAALEVTQPGDVIVIATGGAEQSSVFGDLYVGMAKNRGAVAVVTDGLVRDIDGFEQIGLPVFARGLSPNSPEKNGPGQVGLPIKVGELTIDAGDMLVGDRNGVVVVPRAMIEEVIDHFDAIKTKEAQMEASIKAGARSAHWLSDALNRVGVQYLD